MLKHLILKNRSYRRFHQEAPIALGMLRELVDLARLSPSASNIQPLKYYLCCDRETNAVVFPTLKWAGYLTGWGGPAEGERPSAYVIVLGDTTLAKSFGVDEGIAMQNLLLGAAERGLGGCILGSVNRAVLRQALDIPERYEILHVIALGVPSETVVLEEVGPEGDIKYWRDAESVHHVPKRSIDELILAERG